MRTCIIDLPGLDGRLLDRLPADSMPFWFSRLLEQGRTAIRPPLPAVTMPVQATYTTGVTPAEHGMIANGVPAYRLPELRDYLDLSNFENYRCNVSFWEQSNNLLQAPSIWKTQGRSCAMMFVQSSMYGSADVVVTPKPEHTEDGKTIPDCWSSPSDLYARLREQLGEFPLHFFWGPMAGMGGSKWIIAAARLTWEWEPTDLMWAYIPQLDYDLQRLGPDDQRNAESLAEVLGLLTPLVEKVHGDGGRVLLLSEYGMKAVNRSVAPNTHFRRAGLLQTDKTGDMDYDHSRAFAMVDHQLAHIYCTDDAATKEARQLLEDMPEVDRVYQGPERAEIGLDSPRAGDLVALAQPDAWFEYRWFEDFTEAPEFIWTIDIHRKPGYDPLEMWADPTTRKILADQPHLVKGSHGLRSDDPQEWPVLIGHESAGDQVDATDIARLI